ncbi:MAG: DUF2279 domain-containing protein [Ignavibacteriales bacterium]|nr:DUF2279 domain-containing protein [Ignavibacteriales bacterium]
MIKSKIRNGYLKFLILLLILFTITPQNIFSQEKKVPQEEIKVPLSLMSKSSPGNINPFKSEINYPMLAGVGLTYSYIIYEINKYYSNTWWKKDSRYEYNGKFNVVSDGTYARNIDKYGHVLGTSLISHFFSAGLEAANIDEETCVWWGAIGGLGMQLYVEVQDGFSPVDKISGKPKWGFSPGDAISDLLGASFFVARYYYPYLNNFQLRFSYYPSKELLNGDKPDNNYSDDYEGQKVWLAFRMKNLLPENLSEYWPAFLMLSLGYHVSGVGDYYTKPIETHYYLALDIDAETIPLYGKFWAFVKNTLNYIHFPMPGLEISKNGISFALIIF